METLSAPPVLATPDSHILGESRPVDTSIRTPPLSDEQLRLRFEIDKTVRDIHQNRWQRVALQFPDHMLQHSARLYQLMARELQLSSDAYHKPVVTESISTTSSGHGSSESRSPDSSVKLMILGDTSYGSCCVDEIAAEHADADALIHYGRACLSPTTRLPVVHVFTTEPLETSKVVEDFTSTFSKKDEKVILTADAPYALYVEDIAHMLLQSGHVNLHPARIVHDPSSLIPNRSLPASVASDLTELKEWTLYHISEPPTALLLILSSRLKAVQIYPTDGDQVNGNGRSCGSNVSMLLSRRYALVTSLSTVTTWGILINTLSVKNYLHIVEHIKQRIAAAGRKSYLFVVGKLNASKVANFSEIGGWVVVGCWESSLIDSRDYFKPIITPFELDLVLAGDEQRTWTGAWTSDFQKVLDEFEDEARTNGQAQSEVREEQEVEEAVDEEEDDDEESEPPEFDLRTGRYVTRSRPMKTTPKSATNGARTGQTTALVQRSKGNLVSINGVASPAAQFLNEKRTWKGLGSDFEVKYDEEVVGSSIQEGRTGVARGYAVGDSKTT